jgi:hypothetical protein
MTKNPNMKTSKFAIITDDGKHDYDITVFEAESSKSYQMSYSNGSQWTEHTRGEHILTATDHGNGVRINEKIGKNIDYDKLTELKIMLDFIYKYDDNIAPSYEIYEKL